MQTSSPRKATPPESGNNQSLKERRRRAGRTPTVTYEGSCWRDDGTGGVGKGPRPDDRAEARGRVRRSAKGGIGRYADKASRQLRSEEHTSELQSRQYIV